MNRKTQNILSGVILVIFFLYLIIGNIKSNRIINEYPCFIYCKTIGKKFYYQGGEKIHFEYYYEGRKYYGRVGYKDKYRTNGAFYLIKISKKEPSLYKSYFSIGEVDTSNLDLKTYNVPEINKGCLCNTQKHLR